MRRRVRCSRVWMLLVIVLTLFCITSGTHGVQRSDCRRFVPVKVDVWENNWVVQRDGSVSLRQVILWEWTRFNHKCDYYVLDWCLIDKAIGPEKIGGRWIGVFKGQLIEARLYRETAYLIDIEVEDRKRIPESDRRKIK